MKRASCLSIALLGACALPPRSPAPVDGRFEPVRRTIQDALITDSIPSISLSVLVNGRVVWEEAFGWADIAGRTPATPGTRYPIASVSKPIVATGVMLLVHRGLFGLDSTVNSVLGSPGLTSPRGDEDVVTIRHVLQHRSGLPSPYGQYFYATDHDAPPPFAATIAEHGMLVEPAGGRYAYSNLGYGVLAHISARLAGAPFDEFLRQEIFDPLRMTSTTLEIGPDLSRPAATSYDAANRPLPYYRFDEWGSGRVYSSAHDLVRFGLLHLKRPFEDQAPILPDSLIDLMVTDRQSTGRAGGRFGTDWFYALGWGGRTRTEFGPLWYGHEGAMPGVISELKLLPEYGIAVAVISNSRRAPVPRIVREILDALIPGYATMRHADPSNAPGSSPPRLAPDSQLFGSWRGSILAADRRIPIEIIIDSTGSARARVGANQPAVVDDFIFVDGRLRGHAAVHLPEGVVRPWPHELQFDLRLTSNTMAGVVVAATTGDRLRFVVPFSTVIVRTK
jgi:CubicO group peptidase (beta-lactamase class C family)